MLKVKLEQLNLCLPTDSYHGKSRPLGKLQTTKSIQLINSMLKLHNTGRGTCWFCSPGRILLPHASTPTSCFSFYKMEIICLHTQGKFTTPKTALRYELIYVKYLEQNLWSVLVSPAVTHSHQHRPCWKCSTVTFYRKGSVHM